MKYRPILKKIAVIGTIIFACIGLFLTAGYLAVRFGLTNTSGIIDTQRETFLKGGAAEKINNTPVSTTSKYWKETEEWATVKAALLKDVGLLNRAGATAGVSPRLIASALIVEQLRFYFDDRDSYKKYFSPLKILGSQTQFSWGVMGMKEETALIVEKNLKDKTSPYYLGEEYEHLLDFKTDNIEQERFTRMTDQHAHYYSYLYAGLYLHQYLNQWKAAGIDISKRPEILGTLYNIGFAHSNPNADAKSGGAAITVGYRTYSFGALSAEFYNSNELLEEFPR